jgi:hypothetical protein
MSVYDDMMAMVEIDDETYAKERQLREEKRAKKVKNLNIRRKNMIKAIAVALAAGAGLSLAAVGCSKYMEGQPLRNVTDELLSDAGLFITDDGRNIPGKMTREELVDYIEENNIELDDIKDKVESRLKFDGHNVEVQMDRIMDANPDVFEEETKGGMSK